MLKWHDLPKPADNLLLLRAGKQAFGDESVRSLSIDVNYLYTDNPQLCEVKSERS